MSISYARLGVQPDGPKVAAMAASIISKFGLESQFGSISKNQIQHFDYHVYFLYLLINPMLFRKSHLVENPRPLMSWST